MKNLRLNKKRIYLLALAGFVLINTVGCGKQTLEPYFDNSFAVENQIMQSDDINQKNNNMVENNQNQNLEKIIGDDVKDKYSVDNNVRVDTNDTETEDNSHNTEIISNNDVTYSEEDNVIIEEFNQVKNKVVEFLNSEEVDNARDKAKGVFISVVDFLFYDGEINGVKFDDLTDDGKQKVLELATNIDSYIVKKFPTYKEDISETAKTAYTKASDLIKKGANNIKDFSKEQLGEENYNAIVDAKDELVEYTKEAAEVVGNISSKLWSNAKEKIKNWYEGFREN